MKKLIISTFSITLLFSSYSHCMQLEEQQESQKLQLFQCTDELRKQKAVLETHIAECVQKIETLTLQKNKTYEQREHFVINSSQYLSEKSSAEQEGHINTAGNVTGNLTMLLEQTQLSIQKKERELNTHKNGLQEIIARIQSLEPADRPFNNDLLTDIHKDQMLFHVQNIPSAYVAFAPVLLAISAYKYVKTSPEVQTTNRTILDAFLHEQIQKGKSLKPLFPQHRDPELYQLYAAVIKDVTKNPPALNTPYVMLFKNLHKKNYRQYTSAGEVIETSITPTVSLSESEQPQEQKQEHDSPDFDKASITSSNDNVIVLTEDSATIIHNDNKDNTNKNNETKATTAPANKGRWLSISAWLGYGYLANTSKMYY